MIKIHELNKGNHIVIYSYKGMNIADGGHCATVIDLSKKNFEYDTAIVRTDGQEKVLELTDEDYFDKLPTSHKKATQSESRDIPSHYQGTGDIDLIEFCRQQFTPEMFRGAMMFTIMRYATRLGRKDENVKELNKIIDYAERYKEVLEDEQ
ncbi:hypothetical protein AMC75_11760 [Staphylococcus carnosus]|uniref:DUF3310 domain-containing protein n=1 Tax=Staphylococcus carnosus TaxID=1281 RepID=UPI0006AB9B8F|nr:DUF3310 domain-containing protein [Staphylococcus carnosus]KOR12034.1 hypothetical protein AMC75_11760 [Staphylococcus carnosus]